MNLKITVIEDEKEKLLKEVSGVKSVCTSNIECCWIKGSDVESISLLPGMYVSLKEEDE